MWHNLVNGLRTMAAVAARSSRLAGPRTAALILSRTCDSQCVMCWYHAPLAPSAGAADGREFMDTGLAETLLEQFRALGVYRVVLGGHGEPTLHPDFDRLLDRAHDLGLMSYVISNGLGLDPARVRRWAGRRAHFRFSLHGGDAATWLRVHPGLGEDDFERVESGVRQLAAGGRAAVSTMHVVQRANEGRLRATVEQAARLGVRSVLYMPVRADPGQAHVVLPPDQVEAVRAELGQCARDAARRRIRTNLGELLTTFGFTAHGEPSTRRLYAVIPCVIGHLYLEIDIDGTVRPCEGSRIVLGTARDCTHLERLWRSTEYESFRSHGRRLPTRSEPVPGCPCHQCTMAPFNLAAARLLRLGRVRLPDA